MNFVAYYRVSTARQQESGLSLESQQHTVEQHVHNAGGQLVASFKEAESGRKNSRPQLQAALAVCKQNGATLVIAKMDRLARSVLFTATLMESGVEFVACDNPHATRLTIHILAAVAEDEARRISQRIKDAFEAKRKRGESLGTPGNLIPAAGTAANAAAADAMRKVVRPVAEALRGSGYTLEAVATTLTGLGLTTRRNKPWTATAVCRLLG